MALRARQRNECRQDRRAWWQDRSDRQKLNNGLANLQAELRSNIEMIDRYQKLHQAIVDAGVALLEAEPADATVEQVGRVFVQGWVTDYSTGALDIVLGSTRLDLIEDQQLRAELMALPAGYEDAIEDERWAIDELMGKWIPYISKIASVARSITGNSAPGKARSHISPTGAILLMYGIHLAISSSTAHFSSSIASS